MGLEIAYPRRSTEVPRPGPTRRLCFRPDRCRCTHILTAGTLTSSASMTDAFGTSVAVNCVMIGGSNRLISSPDPRIETESRVVFMPDVRLRDGTLCLWFTGKSGPNKRSQTAIPRDQHAVGDGVRTRFQCTYVSRCLVVGRATEPGDGRPTPDID